MVTSHARTTAIAAIGDRLAALSNVSDYASDAQRRTTVRIDRTPTPVAVPPGGATYGWGPMEYVPAADRVTFRVMECAGTSTFNVATAPGNDVITPAAVFPSTGGIRCQSNLSEPMLPDEDVLDLYETAYRKRRGVAYSDQDNSDQIGGTPFWLAFPVNGTWAYKSIALATEFARGLGVPGIASLPRSFGTPWHDSVPTIVPAEALLANFLISNASANATLAALGPRLQAWFNLPPSSPDFGGGTPTCILTNDQCSLNADKTAIDCPVIDASPNYCAENNGIDAVVATLRGNFDAWTNMSDTTAAFASRVDALNTGLLAGIFSAAAYGVMSVCENDPGFVRCGDVGTAGGNPYPATNLLQPMCGSASSVDSSVMLQQCTPPSPPLANPSYDFACGAAVGACTYGITPAAAIAWTSATCRGDVCTQMFQDCIITADDTCVTPSWNVSAASVLAEWTLASQAQGNASKIEGFSFDALLPKPLVDPVTAQLVCQLTTGGPSCITRCGDAADPRLIGLTADHPPVPCTGATVQNAAATAYCAFVGGCEQFGLTPPNPPGVACYYAPGSQAAIIAAGGGCHGHGTCFDPIDTGASSTCTCTGGLSGQFCDVCAPGSWGYPVVAQATGARCPFTCMSTWPNDTAFASAEDETRTVMRYVWQPSLSTGIYNLTDACLRPGLVGGPWAVESSLIGGDGTIADSVSTLISMCDLLQPVTDSVAWLALAKGCVVQLNNGSSALLSTLCDFSGTVIAQNDSPTLQEAYEAPVWRFPASAGNIRYADAEWGTTPMPAIGPLTPFTLLGCPSDWDNDTARNALLQSLAAGRANTVPTPYTPIPEVSPECETGLQSVLFGGASGVGTSTFFSNYTGIVVARRSLFAEDISFPKDCDDLDAVGIVLGWESSDPHCGPAVFDPLNGAEKCAWATDAPGQTTGAHAYSTACTNPRPFLHVNVDVAQRRRAKLAPSLADVCAPLCDPVLLRAYLGPAAGTVGISPAAVLGCTVTQTPPAWLLDHTKCAADVFFNSQAYSPPLYHFRHMVELAVGMNAGRLRYLLQASGQYPCSSFRVLSAQWCYQLPILLRSAAPGAADQNAFTTKTTDFISSDTYENAAYTPPWTNFTAWNATIFSPTQLYRAQDMCFILFADLGRTPYDMFSGATMFTVLFLSVDATGKTVANFLYDWEASITLGTPETPNAPADGMSPFGPNATCAVVDTISCSTKHWYQSWSNAPGPWIPGETAVHNAMAEFYYNASSVLYGVNFGSDVPFPFPFRVCDANGNCTATTDVPTYATITGTTPVAELACPALLTHADNPITARLFAVAAALNAPQTSIGRLRPYHVCDREVFYAASLVSIIGAGREPGPLLLEPSLGTTAQSIDATTAVNASIDALSIYVADGTTDAVTHVAAAMGGPSDTDGAITFLKTVISQHYRRTGTAPAWQPLSPAASRWFATNVSLPDPATRGRVCGGPRRALVCTLSSAAACTAAGFQPCKGNPGADGPLNGAFYDGAFFYCACNPDAGCTCALDSNLDATRACAACLPKTFYIDSTETACVSLAACEVPLSGILCNGADHGTCVLVVANKTTGVIVDLVAARPENEGYVPPPGTELAPQCSCAASWAGPQCSISVPPPASTAFRAPGVPLPPTTLTSANKRAPGWRPCGTSRLAVATTWVADLRTACTDLAFTDTDKAAECAAITAAFAYRVFAYSYNGYAPSLRSDVNECARLDMDVPTLAEFEGAPWWDRAVYARYWAVAPPPGNGTTQLPDVWDGASAVVPFPPTPRTITNATFCIRLRTNDRANFVAVLAPLYGRVTLAAALSPPGVNMGTLSPGSGTESCQFFGAPVCILKNCTFGASVQPANTFCVT